MASTILRHLPVFAGSEALGMVVKIREGANILGQLVSGEPRRGGNDD